MRDIRTIPQARLAHSRYNAKVSIVKPDRTQEARMPKAVHSRTAFVASWSQTEC